MMSLPLIKKMKTNNILEAVVALAFLLAIGATSAALVVLLMSGAWWGIAMAGVIGFFLLQTAICIAGEFIARENLRKGGFDV
jgi:predicted anti-sigma-YlaC factor YlaD